jgi:hypothetical protein
MTAAYYTGPEFYDLATGMFEVVRITENGVGCEHVWARESLEDAQILTATVRPEGDRKRHGSVVRLRSADIWGGIGSYRPKVRYWVGVRGRLGWQVYASP